MAITNTQFIVGMMNAAPGGYKATVDVYINDNGMTAAANILIGQSGLNTQFAGKDLYNNADFAAGVVARLLPGVSATVAASLSTIVNNFMTTNPTLSRGAVVVSMIEAVVAIPTTDPTLGAASIAFAAKVTSADAYTGGSTDLTVLAGVIGVTPTANVGQTFTLNTGANNFTGTSGNDTFDGGVSASFSAFDNLDGGAGTDTLNAALAVGTLPSGATVKNIEIANINTTFGGLVADVSGYTGLTAATFAVAAAGTATITGAATTDLTTSFVSGSSTVNGGKAIVVTSTALGNTETLSVGATTAAAGNITITAVSATGTSTGTLAATTKGGTAVSITETGATTANRAMNVTDGAAAATVAGTLSTVTLDGYGATSTVASNALANLTLANSVTGLTVNVTNSLTTAIAAKTSVLGLTLNNVTSTTLIDTNAEIGTLNITVAGAATKNSTLAAITDVNLTALTVTGAAANKLTLSAATGLGGLKTIAVSGATSFTAAVDVSAVATGLTGVTTTGTGTVTLGATTVTQGIATTTAYTGGAGNDILTIGATKAAIDLGTGTNTLYMLAGTTAVGTGGTVTSGAGTSDTLFMVAADAATASTTTTFASKVTGFERLEIGTQTGVTVDVAKLLGATNASYVTTTGAGNTLQLDNLNTTGSGATVIIQGSNAVANTGLTLAGSSGAGATDVVNLKLLDTAVSTGVVTFGSVSAKNVETINLSVNDARTTTVPIQNANTVTIVDDAMQTLNISGNQSIVVTYTAGTALTSVDASGLTLGSLTMTPGGALQYAATVKGSLLGGDTISFTNSLATVTITETAGTNSITGSLTIGSTLNGGTGADTIVGGAGVDTITGGAGADIITGGAGADIITLGLGADIVRYGLIATSTSATGANVDKITDFLAGTDKINLTGAAGGLATTLTGVTITTTTAATATMATAVANTTSVATIADVYTALAAYTTLTASGATGTATVAQVYTFATGAAAGTYLVINDATIGFQAATDIVINLTGLSGTFSGTDITYTA